MAWRLLTYRAVKDPSRHRVAIWRELRRAGAVSLQAGTWAIPTDGEFEDATARAVELIERGEGEVFLFDVTPTDPTSRRLEMLFTAEREAEWGEFLAECDKVAAELAHEVEIGKLTLAELDEEEQSYERLQRWFGELRTKDRFGAPSAAIAGSRLKECAAALENYAELVYEARHR